MEEADICILICMYLHKKHLSAAFAFGTTALLESRTAVPLRLLGSLEESHEDEDKGADQRSRPWGAVHTQPPPGHLVLVATLRDISLLHPSPHCQGLRMQSSALKIQRFPRETGTK